MREREREREKERDASLVFSHFAKGRESERRRCVHWSWNGPFLLNDENIWALDACCFYIHSLSLSLFFLLLLNIFQSLWSLDYLLFFLPSIAVPQISVFFFGCYFFFTVVANVIEIRPKIFLNSVFILKKYL